jgi:hypothetical protein
MDFVVSVSLMLQQMCCLWFYLLNGGTLEREPLVMGQIGTFSNSDVNTQISVEMLLFTLCKCLLSTTFLH